MSDLADLLAEIAADVARMAAKSGASTWTWGVVTAVAPLRVRLDRDDDALDITPKSLAVVAVGDTVWCQLYGTSSKQLIVHGKAV